MKERYIEMRNSKTIDWQFIYEYAISKGFTLSVNEFNVGAGYLNMNIDFVLELLDREYELTLLFNQRGEFIKVVT